MIKFLKALFSRRKVLFMVDIKTYVDINTKKILGINGHALLSSAEDETLPLIAGLPKRDNKILRARIIVFEEEVERLGNGKDKQIAHQNKAITKMLGQDTKGECYVLNRKSKSSG